MTGVEEQLAELLKSAVPVCGVVAFEDVERRVRHRRSLRWSVVGSAAAVVAVAAAVPLIGPSGGAHTRRPAMTPSIDLTGTIPWIGAPARPYEPPPGTPLPPAPSNALPCAASDVAASLAGGNGAGGGHLLTYVRFRNTGRSTCVLKGYPRVIATQAGLPDVAATNGSFFQSGSTANMVPGQETLLGLETDSYCSARPGGGGASPAYHHIAIVLPGGGTVALDRAPGGFDVTCGLHLTTFFVQQAEPTQPHDPLNDLRASLEVPPTVSAGATLVYVVDLGNPTGKPISLDPCPGYIESARSSTPIKELYALNCTTAKVIAANHTTRFEMRMHIPATTPPGPLTIRWMLTGPNTTTASATVNVTPTPTKS